MKAANVRAGGCGVGGGEGVEFRAHPHDLPGVVR